AGVSALVTSRSKAVHTAANAGGPKRFHTQPRSEPIYYNGQHYALNYTYNDAMKAFDMMVSGTTAPMKSDAQKDAINIASSSLGYFACPEGQRGRLVGSPKFKGGVWTLQARCG